MSIKIIEARLSDLTAIEQLKISELTYSPDPLEQTQTYLEQFPAFLGQKDDEIGAFIYSRECSKDILELYNLLVKREWRGAGVGSRLVTRIESRAKELGYRAVILTNSQLYTGHEKRSAVPFYEKIGYSIIQQTAQSTVMFKHLSS